MRGARHERARFLVALGCASGARGLQGSDAFAGAPDVAVRPPAAAPADPDPAQTCRRFPRGDAPADAASLRLTSATVVACLWLWNAPGGGVQAQLVWRGADADGRYEARTRAAPFRVQATEPDGTYTPGAVHLLREASRRGATIERCIEPGHRRCELLWAPAGGAITSVWPRPQ